ncbi:hypothetical protein SAMN02745245_01570 [Anaerosphaera aminiphila DSM 21120]|uniref:Uncharacterized protein n=1 Tax=Anaerosphaera aminiphila DSM 21120 TaxID=1120995 RepID=A0A1M5TTW7_9FIRM|nr:hypothetical protein [Anaerosphaera aminiphila]SHH54265.1 hypothetical protein SAMN02745245_01570 [Anaerosphaera aminiphila DSM 21120]
MKKCQNKPTFQKILQILTLGAIIKSAIFSFCTLVLLVEDRCNNKRILLDKKGDEKIEKE